MHNATALRKILVIANEPPATTGCARRCSPTPSAPR